ncbi:MAG: FAD-dependent oxidoreductase, partial [Acidobacteriota bacterium]|nr:FAD-dependent oxidoreductase [Acidobacteriota bacterium]
MIIGCGIAGATAALQLARNPGRQITILTRAADPHESNTQYAQGGIIG